MSAKKTLKKHLKQSVSFGTLRTYFPDANSEEVCISVV